MNNTTDDAAEALGQAMSGDKAMRTRAENRLAGKILLGVVVALVLVGLLIALVGPHVLGPLGLVATLLVFVILLAFTAGK